MDLSKLTKEQKQYMVIGIIALCGVGYGLFAGISYVAKTVTVSKTELEELNTKVDRAERELSRREKTMHEFDQTITVLESHLRNLPPEANYYAWATEIVFSKGRDAGLEIESVDEIKPDAGKNKNLGTPVYFEMYTLRITARGGLREVKAFLKDVEDNHPLARFSGLEISKSMDPEKHNVQLYVQWPFQLNRITALWKDHKRQMMVARQEVPKPAQEKTVPAVAAAPEKEMPEPVPEPAAEPVKAAPKPVVAAAEPPPAKRPTPPSQPAPSSKRVPTQVVVSIPAPEPEPALAEPEPVREPAPVIAKEKTEPEPVVAQPEPVMAKAEPAPEPVVEQAEPMVAAAEPEVIVEEPEAVSEPAPVIAKETIEPEPVIEQAEPMVAAAEPEPIPEDEPVLVAETDTEPELFMADTRPAAEPVPEKTDDHFSDILASISLAVDEPEDLPVEASNPEAAPEPVEASSPEQEEIAALLTSLGSRGMEEDVVVVTVEAPPLAEEDLAAYLVELEMQQAEKPVEETVVVAESRESELLTIGNDLEPVLDDLAVAAVPPTVESKQEPADVPVADEPADTAPEYASTGKSAEILEELLMKKQPKKTKSLGSFLDGIVGDINDKH